MNLWRGAGVQCVGVWLGEEPAAVFELGEDEAEDHGVWDELTGLDLGFGMDAEWCTIADIFAEEVAGGDGG